MDNDVCAVVERVLYVWAEECVVHHHHYAMLMRYCRDSPYINQFQRRIARSLDPYQFRLVRPYLTCYIEFDTWGECDLHTMGCSHLGEISVCAAVDIGDGDDMGACGEGLEDDGCGCGAGGESEGVFGLLESCYSCFEVFPVKVLSEPKLYLCSGKCSTDLDLSFSYTRRHRLAFLRLSGRR